MRLRLPIRGRPRGKCSKLPPSQHCRRTGKACTARKRCSPTRTSTRFVSRSSCWRLFGRVREGDLLAREGVGGGITRFCVPGILRCSLCGQNRNFICSCVAIGPRRDLSSFTTGQALCTHTHGGQGVMRRRTRASHIYGSPAHREVQWTTTSHLRTHDGRTL